MLCRFWDDKRGNYALMMVVAMIPILGGLALAVDYGEMARRRQLTLNALDAAAIATAREIQDGATDDQARVYAKQFFEANLHSLDPADTTLTVTLPTAGQNTVKLKADLKFEPYFLPAFTSLLGNKRNRLDFAATSEVTVASRDLEVALVLDTTASMAGQRIIDLSAAAAELIDIVVQDKQTPTYSKVALAPYSMAVNVGTYAQNVRGTYNSGTCNSPGCASYKFTSPNGNKNTFSISTCVTERTGTDAYTDSPPSSAPLGRNYPSSGNPCLTNTIAPLSSDKVSLKAKVSTLTASGSTGGHVGVAWGWYLVSPKFGYLWPSSSPAAYKTKNLDKVVVIMTDGEYNSVYCKGVIAQNSTSGSGSSNDHINCDAPNGGSYSQAQELCKNMKNEGVIVYTVGLNVINKQEAKDLVSLCATDADHVYLPNSGTELKTAFRDIAQSISKLRISR